MKTIRFREYLRTNDVGIYRLTYGPSGFTVAYLVLIDLMRPSTIDDFPHLISTIEPNEDFGRANFIKAIIISDRDFDHEHQEEIQIVAGQFLEGKDETDWNLVYFKRTEEDFERIDEDRVELFRFVEQISHQMNKEINLISITPDRFNYLSQ